MREGETASKRPRAEAGWGESSSLPRREGRAAGRRSSISTAWASNDSRTLSPPRGAAPDGGRRLSWRRWAILGLVVTLGCSARSAPPPIRLVVGRPGDAIGLDPARITDADSAEVCRQIFEGLVGRREGSTEIGPVLAERWEVTPDGLTWTFHLRPRVTFHDGTPVDAAAVVFTFQRLLEPDHPFHTADMEAWAALYRHIERVEEVDARTVRLHLEQSFAPLLANLALSAAAIVSPTAVRKSALELARHPVGSGPFRFLDWRRGQRVVLEANDRHWRRRPAIDRLVFAVIADPRQRLVAVEGGTIDVAERLRPEDVQFAALHPELRLVQVAGDNVSYLAMNTARPPFDDPRVRRAVSHAIDREPILKLLHQGLARAASGPLPPSSWARTEQGGYAHDPELARRLLAEAGYDHRRRPRLFAVATARSYLPAPEAEARLIAGQLAEVGIEVELSTWPLEEFIRRSGLGEHDLCLAGANSDSGDPDDLWSMLLAGSGAEGGAGRNLAFLRDGPLDGILRWAQAAVDPRERRTYYATAQRRFHELVPWVPLANADVVVVRRRDVEGLTLSPSSMLDFAGASRRGR